METMVFVALGLFLAMLVVWLFLPGSASTEVVNQDSEAVGFPAVKKAHL